MSALILILGLLSAQDPTGDSLDRSESPADWISVWVNKEDGSYQPGEKLKVYFKSDQDCYVAVYDIEVGGGENLLFPQNGDEAWVEAGKVYELPPASADYDYEIKGPEGVESIVMLGSKDHLPKLGEEQNSPEVIKKSVEIYIKEPEPARLRIISSPKKCRIYITEISSGEEEYVGKASRTIVLSPGEYLIKIKKSGYRTLTRRIRLEPDERRRVFVRLLEY